MAQGYFFCLPLDARCPLFSTLSLPFPSPTTVLPHLPSLSYHRPSPSYSFPPFFPLCPSGPPPAFFTSHSTAHARDFLSFVTPSRRQTRFPFFVSIHLVPHLVEALERRAPARSPRVRGTRSGGRAHHDARDVGCRRTTPSTLPYPHPAARRGRGLRPCDCPWIPVCWRVVRCNVRDGPAHGVDRGST